MRESGIYDDVPLQTSVEKEMRRIGTRDQLRQRITELTRIQKSVKSDSWDVVLSADGKLIPKYLEREIELAKRSINAEHREVRESLFPEWAQMSNAEQAMYSVNANIDELHGGYSTSSDLDDLVDERYAESDYGLMQKYIAAWHEHCTIREYEEQVVSIINWLLENRPGAIREILARGYVQATIDYIYPGSADLTDLKLRHQNIIDFWEDMREYYS